SRANLSRANDERIIIEKTPIQIATGEYHVIIFDAHMKIGCEFHSLADWWNFDNERVAQMDGTRSRRFWDIWKAPLMAVCEANGRK
ncbi:MAG TPA: pentapeptide repeat-containing protein, partial [Geobacter sp.]|nr:pentapeptide repeat-containing protein [Geobacter sp.]